MTFDNINYLLGTNNYHEYPDVDLYFEDGCIAIMSTDILQCSFITIGPGHGADDIDLVHNPTDGTFSVVPSNRG